MIKNLPVMWETWVLSLSQENSEEGMATTPVLLAGELHGQREPGCLQIMVLPTVHGVVHSMGAQVSN